MSAEPIPSYPAGFTPEEYLALERAAEFKSEYCEGQIFAMAGGSSNHAAIAANIAASLVLQLRGKPCRVFSSDLRVATASDGAYVYPDLSVACGEARFLDGLGDTLINPTLVVEVLSPSSEAYDRGKKFYYYRRIESLTDYLLVSQEEPFIDYYHKLGDNQWVLNSVQGLEGNLYLPSLGVTLRLSEAYDKIMFPPPVSEGEKTEAGQGQTSR